MKKEIKILVALLTVFVMTTCVLFGYVLGSRNSSKDKANVEPSVVGAYKTDNWNGAPGVLVLKPDGTCLYPTREGGFWSQNGNVITIVLNSDREIVYDNQGVSSYKDLMSYTAEVVQDGIILVGMFFQKVN